MTTIPASQLVTVNPSVISAGGSSLDIIGLILSTSTRVPIGTVQSFPDAASVSDFFGGSSQEDSLADIYFQGFDGSTKKPGSVLYAQYNDDAVAAYLRGGDISALSLAALQAISGSLDIVIDGQAFNAPSVNLSAATSFSSGATIIETAIDAAAPSAASVTASIGGIVTASAGAAFTGSGSGTNLTASSVTGVIHVGAAISGTGVPSGTYIVSQTSGSAGAAGVYVTNHSTTSSSDSITAISNTLDVTGVTSGTLQPTDVLSGTGVATGTTILAQNSGSAGSTGLYTISTQQHIASTAVTSLSTILNVTAVGSGSVEVGATLAGTGVTSGTVVTANGTGSGGTGTYSLSKSSTTISETITSGAASPTVTYDSQSGAYIVTSGTTGATSAMAFATGTIAATLLLTSATGAVLSQGADAAEPGDFMDGVIAVTTDWVTFMTAFDPDGGSGITVREAFADWVDTQNDRYAYVCWDTDAAPTTTLPASSSLGVALTNSGSSGTNLNWAPDDTSGAELAAFICGAAASIDFARTNARTTFAFLSQSGIEGGVTTATAAANLGGLPSSSSRGNGYNFYGAYGAANLNFIWYQRGFVTGDFLWLDSYINQIWLNSSCQLALLNLLANTRSIPYSAAGNSLIEASLKEPIQAALNFGAIAPGSISAAQIAAVNAMAGADVARTLQTQGYYLQILPASSTVRAARTSPPCTLFYLDRGSVQQITLASVAVN